MMDRMNVHVDADRCQGHGRCYLTAPDLFAPDDVGNGRPVGDGAVPAALQHDAQLAVANCPERAVSLEGA
jgi:ferredoxin